MLTTTCWNCFAQCMLSINKQHCNCCDLALRTCSVLLPHGAVFLVDKVSQDHSIVLRLQKSE